MKSKLALKVKGRNPVRFIKRLYEEEIELLKIYKINREEICIHIYKEDLEKVISIKSIYEIIIIKYYGIEYIKSIFNKNKILIAILILGSILLFILSNIIFNVQVIHNNDDLRKLLTEVLSEHGIRKHSFIKSYEKIGEIKENILEDYKDKIEWIEIERHGTTYIIRVEERIIPNLESQTEPQSIVAKKSAIIQNVKASHGVILKNKGQYVNVGEVIIDGNISLNEEVKTIIRADGKVYGEVWYTIKIEYPYIYREESLTSKEKKVLMYNFLNNHFSLFKNKYKKYNKKELYRIGNSILPICITYELQREKRIIEYILTEEEAYMSGLEKSRKQMQGKLKKDEYIMYEKVLKSEYKESTIEMDVFYAVYEDITEYKKIEQEN